MVEQLGLEVVALAAVPAGPAHVRFREQLVAHPTRKVFNEIPAGCSGTVAAMLVEDQEAVEFGKRLFKVDTQE